MAAPDEDHAAEHVFEEVRSVYIILRADFLETDVSFVTRSLPMTLMRRFVTLTKKIPHP